MEENFTPEVEMNEEIGTEVDESTAETTEADGSEQSEQTEKDYSEILKAIEEKAIYNGNPLKFDKFDDVIATVQKGANYEKVLEKVSKYESNPLYKWAEEYSRKNGFEDPNEFLEAVKQEEEQRTFNETVEKYRSIYGDEAAEAMADMQLKLSKLEQRNQKSDAEEQKTKEYTDFLNWYNGKLEKGVFTEQFDANKVPDKVWEYRQQGMNWKEAYSEYQLDNMKILTEQEVIKKIEQNAKTSTGSIKDNNTDTNEKLTPEYIESMTEKYGRDWVKQNYNKIVSSGYYN